MAFDAFPDEILSEIFQWIQAPDIPMINRVCKRWDRILTDKHITQDSIELRIPDRNYFDDKGAILNLEITHINGLPYGWSKWAYSEYHEEYIREFMGPRGLHVRREYGTPSIFTSAIVELVDRCNYNPNPGCIIHIFHGNFQVTEYHPQRTLDIKAEDVPLCIHNVYNSHYTYDDNTVENIGLYWSSTGRLYVIHRTTDHRVLVYYKGDLIKDVSTERCLHPLDDDLHILLTPSHLTGMYEAYECRAYMDRNRSVIMSLLDPLIGN